MLLSTFVLSCLSTAVSAALSDSSLEKHVNSLSLSASFNPIKESYWTGYPHHRRTPFAVSPDGKSAYLAYLDASETDVHVQQVDPSTFAAVGTATTVSDAKEAGGLVAHNDGFALLTNEALASSTANAPAGSTPVPVLYRYTSGKQTWKTYLGGPGVHEDFGLAASPDMNGDLAFSEAAGIYGAYFVVTAYTGSASGHFGDSIQYIDKDGKLQTITGASSSWGCSHNTGIAFEAADSAPFASLCAEDQGAIWLNTKTQSMNGIKVSNENTTNGGSGEPMGGMSGSYSGLARFVGKDSYIFTWVSRGAKDLTTNDWLGEGFTHSQPRTTNRNVAIAQFSDKNTLVGDEATSQIGGDGDSQVNWITQGSADCSNAHVAAFDGENALVTWEEIAEPTCDFVAMGCKGAFTGSYFQLVNGGKKVGDAVKATDVTVAGDMVTMSDGRICWPYVDMDWKLDGPIQNAASVKEISFACMSLDGAGNSTTAPSSSSAALQSSSAAQATAEPTSAVREVASSTVPVSSTDVASSAAPLASTPEATSAVVTSTPEATPEPTPSVSESFVLVSSAQDGISAAPTPSAEPTPIEAPSAPASQAPSNIPTPPSFSAPNFPIPSGFPSGFPPFPTGFPSGFPVPTGFPFPSGYGRGPWDRARPSGRPWWGYGQPERGFRTKVRPSGTGGAETQAQQTPCEKGQ
ncbi:hypothetical protein K469DRAFT_710812 [Zopfia rhizophila CBS 207.26]|uniref:Uncharacterized protein n=1 Tax=Zopfia rhizophila CBS 207.26 TaxID=1314779 RepID=A0A6A6DUD0_9PEZI|nr:hypothetical protein K469DRAFT_710812 [Zopfia rhizophila CBS 207.26]